MHRIVIELYDHTSDAEADEFIREIRETFQPSGKVFAERGGTAPAPADYVLVDADGGVLDHNSPPMTRRDAEAAAARVWADGGEAYTRRAAPGEFLA